MDAVKIYDHINQEDEKLSFSIFKMEDVHAQRNGKTDSPHRHNYYTSLFTKKAKGQHLIDFNEYMLSNKQAYFIAPGQVHQIIEEEPSIGYGMLFSDQFLVEHNISLNFMEGLQLFNEFGDNPPLDLNDEIYKRIFLYLDEIYRMHATDMDFKYDAIAALLKTVLIECKNSCSLPQKTFHANDSIFHQFKKLINQHYKNWHATKEYSAQLNITPDHLNRIVKAQSGKTAKEHIQNRIIVAAKRMLYFSNLSQKEIAFELGFSEPANFSAFFKHCEGISPSKFISNS